MLYCKPEALSLKRAQLDVFSLKVSHAFQSRKKFKKGNSSKEFHKVGEGRKKETSL